MKGGSETYYFSLKRLLEQNGHQVIDFSMKDDHNFKSDYEDYFVENVEYNGKTSITDKFRMASHIIYSMEAKRKLERLIRDTRPDIAHLHIFQHQMSPSILSVLSKYKIPMVYTAHDLKMLCLNYKMMNRTGICEKCKGHRYYNCVRYGCIKGSVSKSMICMIEGYLHAFLKSYDKIDCIITPSKFYYDKFIEFGVDSRRVRYIPNFLEMPEERPATCKGSGEEDGSRYVLYLGRISEEKGVLTLIRAVEGTEWSLKIAGTGPLLESCQEYITQHHMENVELLGFKQGEPLRELVQRARAIVLPSEWYENSPYSGIEAISQGKVIIGSDLGGIPELIREGRNGYLFHAGDISALRACISRVNSLDEKEYQRMEAASRELFEAKFTAKLHYQQLMEVYRSCGTYSRK